MATMDSGLWITWYDLPAEGRDEYFSWLHGTYMPEILRRPGVLWGTHYAEVDKTAREGNKTESLVKFCDDPTVPTGSRFILIFGGECANVFGNPVPSELHAGMSEANRKMLALRIGARVNIMAETGRVEGPEMKAYQGGLMPANCIQLGTYDTTWQNTENLLAYYTQMRLPAMQKMAGCVRTRKLVSVTGWAKHGVLYEFTSLAARNNNFPRHQDGHPEMLAWSAKMVPMLTHAPGSANVAVRMWPKG